jgi:protein involved in polysaccharide export with SLBB domain
MTRPPASPRPSSRPLRACAVLAAALLTLPFGAHAQFSGNTGNDLTSSSSTDLSQVNGRTDTAGGSSVALTPRRSASSSSTGQEQQPEPAPARIPPYQPSEFELYVQRLARSMEPSYLTDAAAMTEPGTDDSRSSADGSGGRGTAGTQRPLVRRFGANLLTDPVYTSAALDPLPTVPADYIIRPGDEIVLTLWGSVDADLRLTVDRAGRIAVPRVGSITVAGLSNGELADAITRRVGQTFRNFQLTATLGQVRAIRVFVGGYAQRPGSVMVNGLSSILHAIMRAGGPSAAGSFRDIHLRRGGREIAVFDLYDLLLKGNRDTDQLVQPDDVIFIGPVGPQVAVLGSVNQQAIYELKPGEKLRDVLRMAGGFNAVADRGRVTIERLADRASGHVNELALPAHLDDALDTGDVLRAYSVVAATLPLDRQNKRVHVDGEVQHPGDYLLPAGSHISDAVRMAGGMTPGAFPFGTEFTRESVRRVQQANYERALRDLETDIAKNQSSQRVTSQEEAAGQSAAAASNTRLLERLRQVRPTGRVVLPIEPDATTLPDLALEDGDRITIPPRSSSVGVFGSVFTTGSFVYASGHTMQDYIALAGGPTRGADKGSEFVIRANGSVISARQGASFWHEGSRFNDAEVEPGDTIFVPEEMNKSTFVQDAKDWTQILYQFGLGLAGIKSLGL